MIKLLGKLPKDCTIALSGGVDSMVLADFISKTRNIKCAFFHHGTTVSDEAEKVVISVCKEKGWELSLGRISESKPSGVSPEEHWRNERYSWLDSLNSTILTGHHLDDCVETYLWSVMHGTPKLIPYRRNNVIRPLLITAKSSLVSWAEKHNVEWIDDHTNKDTRYMRNYVREHIMPHAYQVNPGLHKVISRKVIESFKKQETEQSLEHNY